MPNIEPIRKKLLDVIIYLSMCEYKLNISDKCEEFTEVT